MDELEIKSVADLVKVISEQNAKISSLSETVESLSRPEQQGEQQGEETNNNEEEEISKDEAKELEAFFSEL